MKEQVLATKDEIVVRDLYPVLVSNKRVYIVNGKYRKFKRVSTKKIIQIDKISAIRYQFAKHKLLCVLGFVFMIFTLLAGGIFAYLFFNDKEMLDKIAQYLIFGAAGTLLVSLFFFLLYGLCRKKVIWFEYPTNIAKPTKIVFKRAKRKDFNDLVSAIFASCDKLSSPVTSPFKSPHDLFI